MTMEENKKTSAEEGPSILIASHEILLHKHIAQALEKRIPGVNVYTSHIFEDCVELIRNNLIDVILITNYLHCEGRNNGNGLEYSFITGTDVIDKLTNDESLPPVCPMMYTCWFDNYHISKGYEHGAFDYIFADIDYDILIAHIKVGINYMKSISGMSKLELKRQESMVDEANGPSFLIADMAAANRMLYKMFLQRRYPNATFHEAENGEECLERLSSNHVDLIIIDPFNMRCPGIIKEIRSNDAYRGIGIIISTSAYIKESFLACYEAGTDAFISKPFDKDVLFAKIDRVLRTRKVLQLC